MGSYSTIEITRKDAEDLIRNKINSSSDSQLSDMLFSMYRDEHLYNYRIVDNYVGSDINFNDIKGIYN